MKHYRSLGWFLTLVGGLILILALSCSHKNQPEPEKTVLDMAIVTDPDTDVGLVLMGSTGEKIVVFGCTSSNNSDRWCLNLRHSLSDGNSFFVLPSS